MPAAGADGDVVLAHSWRLRHERRRRRVGSVCRPARGRDPALEHAPTFSIVITAYQAAETIGGCGPLGADQTHPAEEVIVVDDGSTDDLDGALVRSGIGFDLVTKAERWRRFGP